MKTVYKNENKCCGCSICAQACPKKAIRMEINSEGFKFPVIDHNLCINCGKCVKICDFKNKKKSGKKHNPQTYIYQNSNRIKSQSGGAFFALAQNTINNGGVVYGCVYKEGKIFHARATLMDEIEQMRKSKYVQSDIEDICYLIDKDLKNNKEVLFSGTPCQAAGIASYFENSRYKSKLLLVDIICHGVPSPSIFKEYISWLETKYGGKIENYIFKNCEIEKWGGRHIETFEVNGVPYKEYTWGEILYDNVAMRKSCGNCPYTTTNRKSDITIGDAWNIEKVDSEFNDKIGTSLVIVHSNKGKEKFEQCVDGRKKHVNIEDFLQVNLFMPSKIDYKLRNKFMDLVYINFDEALKVFYNNRHYNKLDKFREKIIRRFNKAKFRGIRRELKFVYRKFTR